MILVGVALAVLSVLMLVCLLALVDQHRSLENVRRHLSSTSHPAEQSLAQLGLPVDLDQRRQLVLIFLSTSCTACRSLARPLGKAPRDRIWIVLEAPSEAAGLRWLSGVGLPNKNVTIEDNQRAISAFGVEVTPAVLVFRDGNPVVGQTAPSYEHLEPLLLADDLPSFLTENPAAAGPSTPSGHESPNGFAEPHESTEEVPAR
jgi:thiol-disulfide isomerase/thioredoxin